MISVSDVPDLMVPLGAQFFGFQDAGRVIYHKRKVIATPGTKR